MMFTEKFSGYTGEKISCEVDGFTVTATLHHDRDHGAPWDEEDGHGPVSDWTRRDKAPGELVLSEDRGSKRFYDFAEAVKIARRDGWGLSDEAQAELIARLARPKRRAVKSVYHVEDGIRQDRITQWEETPGRDPSKPLTRGEICAEAARLDFEHLRRWCADQWHYVGVAVTVEREGVQLIGDYAHALWGIGSDAGEYLTETANELLTAALDSARATIARLAA